MEDFYPFAPRDDTPDFLNGNTQKSPVNIEKENHEKPNLHDIWGSSR